MLAKRTDTNSESPAAEDSPAPAPVTTVRRISNPRARKSSPPPREEEVVAPEPPSAAAPDPEDLDDGPDDGHDDGEWPAQDADDSRPQSEGGGNNKRNKRRRRKGKGGQQQGGQPQGGQSQPQAAAAESAPAAAEGDEHVPSVNRPPRPPQAPPRPRVDATLLAEHAWKIFLAEVSEEGIALISDQDARELSRRCFRMAEIFLEEQARRA